MLRFVVTYFPGSICPDCTHVSYTVCPLACIFSCLSSSSLLVCSCITLSTLLPPVNREFSGTSPQLWTCDQTPARVQPSLSVCLGSCGLVEVQRLSIHIASLHFCGGPSIPLLVPRGSQHSTIKIFPLDLSECPFTWTMNSFIKKTNKQTNKTIQI